MTDKASPNQPAEEPYLARFLQDWAALWLEELQAQASDPEGIPLGGVPLGMLAGIQKSMAGDLPAAMETWRALMVTWAESAGASKPGRGGNSHPVPPIWAGALEALARGVPSAPGLPSSPTLASTPALASVRSLASRRVASRERPTPGAEAAAATPDARDAEIERLTRRVNELEARRPSNRPPTGHPPGRHQG